jgi:hypothetical protein
MFILFEAFKYSANSSHEDLAKNFETEFYKKFQKLELFDVLKLVTDTFCVDATVKQKLMIINLDETNILLRDKIGNEFFQKLLRLLALASERFAVLTILSGTHSVDLFKQLTFSERYFVNVELSLIGIEASNDVLLGMCSDSTKHKISNYLNYLLILCGGVGRYIEFAILQMSIMGAFIKDGSHIIGFKLETYEYFLDNLQDSLNIQNLLDKITTMILSKYSNLFKSYAKSIELISCYTLFQWSVERETIIDGSSIGDLEKEGLIFLEYNSLTKKFHCTVPFITLYWAIKYSNGNVSIPFLKDTKSYFSSEESENITLHIMMLKLWGLKKKNGLDKFGLCCVKLSDLVPLHTHQPDIDIKFRPLFKIKTSKNQLTKKLWSYFWYQSNTDCIAFLNAKGSPFVDSVIFSTPRIGLQEKQGVLDKKRNLDGLQPSTFNDKDFKTERNKFFKNDIFILVTDAKAGKIILGERDVFIDSSNFADFAGPLLALRKLYSTNELNESVKRMSVK